MATMERSFSFRKHEGHMFFIYDHKKKKEEDDPKDAILYFYPRSVKVDDQIALVGGIIGITDFCLEFLPQEMPQIIKLSVHNIALLQHGDYIIGLAGSMDIPPNFLITHMQFLWSTFVFYQGSITALRQRQSKEQFLRKLNMVWDIYLPLCQSQGDVLGQSFQTIPYIKLHRSQGSLFLHASHILQRSLKQNGVLAGALFSKNKVLCTQLSNLLTRKLLLLMMQTQFPSVEVNPNLALPGGVHLIYVYLTQEEYKSLNHRRKKRYSSFLHSSLEDTDIAKDTTVPDVKKSVFSDSAISSGGEQFNSHSANVSAEHHPNSSVGRNNNADNTIGMVTYFPKNTHMSTSEVDTESYMDTNSGSESKIIVEIQGNDSALCMESSIAAEKETNNASHELKLPDNLEGGERDGFSVESLTNSLNISDVEKGEKEQSNDSKGINPSVSASLELNSSLDNPEKGLLSSIMSSSGSVSLNEESRNSSPNDDNGNSSPFDNGINTSPLDKSGNSFNGNCGKLSPDDGSEKLSSNGKSGNFSSNDNSGNLSLNDKSGNSCSNSKSGNSSPIDNESLDEADKKGLKDSDKENSFPEPQSMQIPMLKEDHGEGVKKVNRNLDLEIMNDNLHFSSMKVVSNPKDCENSSDSSSKAGQSNDIVSGEFSHPPSSSDGLVSSSSGKKFCFQRHVSLEDSYSRHISMSGDDSSFQSSCEVRKDDQGTSRKSSVNSLANSDVPSSKDRLTFENLDSENSDFGIMTPDSEFHPMFQGNSLPISLSSLKEADGEDVNYGSFHSCHDGEGGIATQLVNGGKNSKDDKTSNWAPQEDNLKEMHLYIQGHSDTLLVLLIEKEVKCSKNYIHSLWKSCLSHLGELDFEVKNVERHSKDEAENIGALYQYMKYDSFSHSLSGSALLPVTSLANEMVDSCVRMHKDFIFMPDLIDATYRSDTACSFGRRSLNSETYFQIGLPSRGGINPGERTFHLEQTAEKCLVQDHRINLL